MADFGDIASDISDIHLQESLFLQAKRAERERKMMPFTGKCYNCDETIGSQAHFCDTHCREDWTLREWQKTQKFDPNSLILDFEGDD